MVALLAVAAYTAAQMLSDVASLKVGLVLGRAVDMGTFVYPVTFTLRDLVHRCVGRAGARVLIVACGVINVLMAAYLGWVARVPEDPSWGLGREFAAVLAPVWRIVLASIVAEVVSELADTEVYHWFVTYVTRRSLWARVLISNAVSIPLDNLIFCVGAFGWSLPWHSVWEIFVWNFAVKAVVSLISWPAIYLVGRAGPDQD
jgi:uncharacterized integral membrane protein (TIGR00697 family)